MIHILLSVALTLSPVQSHRHDAHHCVKHWTIYCSVTQGPNPPQSPVLHFGDR